MRSLSFDVVLVIAIAASAFAGPIYNVVDLGSLGAGSGAFALNGAGAAAGYSIDARGARRAVRFASGAAVDLGLGRANAINDHGQTAGTTYYDGYSRAAMWDGGLVMLLDAPGGVDSEALAINEQGVVVGSLGGEAARWDDAGLRTLGNLPGGGWSAAYSVNRRGTAAGVAMTPRGTFRAAMWTPESFLLDLGTLGGRDSYAFGINARGEVTGHSAVASGWIHAFLYSGGLMRDLGTLGGGSSYAYGINDLGWVVGYSLTASGGSPHAFLWRDGVLSDLNGDIAAGSRWELVEAYAVNGSGQIAGVGLLDGDLRAFRLDPNPIHTIHNPEPGTFLLLGGGMLALAALRRRRPE